MGMKSSIILLILAQQGAQIIFAKQMSNPVDLGHGYSHCSVSFSYAECNFYAQAESNSNAEPTKCKDPDCAPPGCYTEINDKSEVKYYWNENKIGDCTEKQTCKCKLYHGSRQVIQTYGKCAKPINYSDICERIAKVNNGIFKDTTNCTTDCTPRGCSFEYKKDVKDSKVKAHYSYNSNITEKNACSSKNICICERDDLYSESECPNPINSEEECRARSHGHYVSQTICENKDCAPRGCYYEKHEQVGLNKSGYYWNADKSGSCKDVFCLCGIVINSKQVLQSRGTCTHRTTKEECQKLAHQNRESFYIKPSEDFIDPDGCSFYSGVNKPSGFYWNKSNNGIQCSIFNRCICHLDKNVSVEDDNKNYNSRFRSKRASASLKNSRTLWASDYYDANGGEQSDDNETDTDDNETDTDDKQTDTDDKQIDTDDKQTDTDDKQIDTDDDKQIDHDYSPSTKIESNTKKSNTKKSEDNKIKRIISCFQIARKIAQNNIGYTHWDNTMETQKSVLGVSKLETKIKGLTNIEAHQWTSCTGFVNDLLNILTDRLSDIRQNNWTNPDVILTRVESQPVSDFEDSSYTDTGILDII